ncbi:hypothetical protein ACLGIH_13440 [Streptomyces sp. HMX87]|uniref:hypothetical protein n=1 Tax=Streptomyces sp. HMX87 TaxID=3390849 RepID=UPI003A87D0DA
MSTVPLPEQPDDPSGGPSPSISDEQLESFLREAAEGGGAPAPKEPSARARMVAARLREQDEAAQRAQGDGRGRGLWPRRRRKAQGPSPAAPPGWRTGPAWQEMTGARTRRRGAGAVLGVSLAVALAVVAVRPSLVTDHLPGAEPEAAAPATPLPAETALPTAAPGRVGTAGQPTREHPWRGSPAARWAEGADAIELPEAKAVPGLGEADVELALRHTKEFLVASSLDPAVLRGGTPERALALLEPKQPALLSKLRRSLREPTRRNDPLLLFTRFDPDEVRLAGDVVKVRGHMTFTASRPGEVKVHADYTFVYPLVRAHGDGDRVARTIVRRDLTLTMADPGRWAATRGKLHPESYTADFSNSDCDAHDGYLHPAFPDEVRGPAPTGPAEDPYDRSRPLTDDARDAAVCGVATRT